MKRKNKKARIWDNLEKYCLVPRTDMEKLVKDKKLPIIWKGDGLYLEDIDGTEYIDASSGPYCSNIGHGHKEVRDAIQQQLSNLEYLWYSRGLHKPLVQLSQKIAQLTPNGLNKVRLEVTGCDAIEVALKMARLRDQDRNIVISLVGGYHGTTLGAGSVTGIHQITDLHRRNLSPGTIHIPPPNCYRCPYGLNYPTCDLLCACRLDNTIKSQGGKVAAFLAEPILGEGGGITPPDEYWPLIKEICEKNDVLLIFDEIITGFGRTGKMFAMEHWNVKPDILVVGKGLASLYQPISATIISEEIYDQIKQKGPVVHSHTASCHPVACAAAIANIDVILRDKLVGNAYQMGQYLRKKLDEIQDNSPIVGEVRGKGLLQLVELVKNKDNRSRFRTNIREIVEDKCREKGLITCGSGYNHDAFRIGPPLQVQKGDIDTICNILIDVFKEVEHLE